MLDMAEAGKMQEASKLMARHLDRNRKIKLRILSVAGDRLRGTAFQAKHPF